MYRTHTSNSSVTNNISEQTMNKSQKRWSLWILLIIPIRFLQLTQKYYIYIYNYASSHSGEGKNNGNPKQYRNKTVCDGCSGNIRCEVILLFFCLFMLCSASVNALQIVFSNSSYESAAKWRTCQIFKKDRLLVYV
jgi:hypothetical protein